MLKGFCNGDFLALFLILSRMLQLSHHKYDLSSRFLVDVTFQGKEIILYS